MASKPLKSARKVAETTDKAAREVLSNTAREAESLASEGYYAAQRLRNRVQFVLERLILRGALFRLVVIAVCIALISFFAGLLAVILTREFDSPGDGVWWAFLRMTDPGYLGDDEGTGLRVISTVLTVCGYVLFMGALIAIMTQWLNDRIKRLEMGLTPLVQRNHVLVLGWTSRTSDILRALMMSEGRVKRFLLDLDSRKLNVVLLVEQVTAALRVELQEDLGPWWDERRIMLRSGNMLSVDHLRRADFDNAAAIIIPGEDYSGEDAVANDTRILKAILSIDRNLIVRQDGRPPGIVAEVFDARKVPIAKTAYRDRIDILSSDALVARILAQTVRRPGYTNVVLSMIAHHDGQEVFVRKIPELEGKSVGGIHNGLLKGVFLGVIRDRDGALTPYLNPKPDFQLTADDSLVVLARSFEDCVPTSWEKATGRTQAAVDAQYPPKPRRILLLGWSHKAISLVQELAGYKTETFEVTSCSIVSEKRRRKDLYDHSAKTEGPRLSMVDGDFAVPGVLASLSPQEYDSVVFVASDRFRRAEERDARTVLGCLMLTHILSEKREGPAIIMELIDHENRMLFPPEAAEVVLSPMLISYLLVQVALRRELGAVFEELFGPRGAEILFLPASNFVATGESVSFLRIQEAVAAAGMIAMGIRFGTAGNEPGGGVELNPDRNRDLTLSTEDEIVILTAEGG